MGTLLGGGLALAIGSTGVAIAGILTLLAGGAARDRRFSRRDAPLLGPRRAPRGAQDDPAAPARAAAAGARGRRAAAGSPAGPARTAGGRRERVSRAGRRGRRRSRRRTSPTRRASSTSRSSRQAEYRLPDRALLRRSAPGAGPDADHSARVAEALVQTLANFGVDATVIGQISGPARDALRAAARAGDEGLQGRGPEGRPLLRAGDDGDPHPRADPGQAGRRRRAAEHEPEPRHARRHLRRPAGDLEPALGLARQGHLRPVRLDRPRAHAAHPDRRHDRLGEVGLHQHDPHLGAAALDARGRADDPDRPEADRAQLLRVDPAPADAGGLEPEGGRDRAAQRRRRDGAPLRAPLRRARPQPRRGQPRASARAASRRCRTCWS